MARLVLKRVSKVYPGGVRALDGVSLEVADGELLTLLGPSGSGKTTLLEIVAGLEEPTGGDVVLVDSAGREKSSPGRERSLAGVPPQRREVALVFQRPALFPHLSVFGNLAFGLRARGASKREARRQVLLMAERLGIGHLLERKPAALSAGEAQRVALGRALLRRPRVFLFDEPFSSLDVALRLQMRAELKRLHREFGGSDLGVTTIHVTHDHEEALSLGDRVAVLDAGRLLDVGAPGEIYDRPSSRRVAELVGSPPMNFLDGFLVEEAGEVRFRVRDGLLRLPQGSAARLREHAGRKLVLGIRPERVLIRRGEAPGETSGETSAEGVPIRARPVMAEPLGSRTAVHLVTAEGDRLVALVAPDGARSPEGLEPAGPGTRANQNGDWLDLWLDPEAAQVFEPGPEGGSLTAGRGLTAGRSLTPERQGDPGRQGD